MNSFTQGHPSGFDIRPKASNLTGQFVWWNVCESSLNSGIDEFSRGDGRLPSRLDKSAASCRALRNPKRKQFFQIFTQHASLS